MFKYDASYNPDQAIKKTHSNRKKAKIKRIAIYIILVIISIIWLLPFVYLLLQSFSKTYQYGVFFPSINNLTLQNYVNLFTSDTYPFWRWWLNTMIISLVSSIITTILVLLTSYALSRLRFKLRPAIMKMMLILGMFPGFIGMVVIYFILKMVGISSSIYSLILIYVAGAGMQYYISKGFFDTIPKSLDEAAMIDGANKNTIFWRVIMPLAKPIIVYTLLISFVAPWGDFMMASYLAQGNQNMFNVAVGLQSMMKRESMEKFFTTFCAGGVFTSVPIMILFFFLQRYYVEGVTGGAVKG